MCVCVCLSVTVLVCVCVCVCTCWSYVYVCFVCVYACVYMCGCEQWWVQRFVAVLVCVQRTVSCECGSQESYTFDFVRLPYQYTACDCAVDGATMPRSGTSAAESSALTGAVANATAIALRAQVCALCALCCMRLA